MAAHHHQRTISLRTILAAATLAALAAMMLSGRGRRTAAPQVQQTPNPVSDRQRSGYAAISRHLAEQAGSGRPGSYIRPAGPDAMRDPPRRGWDALDEASDESFPASDPSATY